MKIHTCAQMSPEWFALKSGIPSASSADKILTPTGKLSAQAEGYLNRLLAERAGFGDEPMEPTDWMLRGIELEPEARALFEFETSLPVKQVGWITNDEGTAGCSPDGLIISPMSSMSAGVEIKCPKASTHYGYLRAGVLPTFYAPQVHSSMAITGLSTWHFMSYFPGLDPLLVEVSRDEYTDKISTAITEFTTKLAEQSERFGLSLEKAA